MSRYAVAKPYALPASLDRLTGPTTGPVVLPRYLDWGPPYTYDLTDQADLVLMYERVIREAQSPADLHDHLDRATLLRIWPELFLPRELRTLWQARFPELGPRAAAA
ncbi:hypothetical protein K353_04269 [Kitasatospora sp. SolWspMP-SS2h]|uniref:hypothetical protein n=1 Tax=Kitasatospora sp. SolWspMP-SS2h TaxID=1305729 RepID=UPI000DB99656|nr:hypothetical protein [Kitasatospora sp. SolWspMP-SS2h]RAJ38335.1 hypothetical protein K353_04269 [Kitasatospora sp. SolWspMP-SS2h]